MVSATRSFRLRAYGQLTRVRRRIRSCAKYTTWDMVRLLGVSKRFAGKRNVTALEGVDLEIWRGEMVTIVGPSGSGKSTLLSLIGALDQATEGEVEIDGARLSRLGNAALTRVRRDKIGFIFQFFHLLPTLSCLENVALPLHLRGWPRRKTAARARELLELVGLGDRVDHLADELSGGERQRAGDRAGAERLPADPAGGRADRGIWIDEWGGRPASDPRRPRAARHDGPAGDARCRDRGDCAADDPPPGRPHRRGRAAVRTAVWLLATAAWAADPRAILEEVQKRAKSQSQRYEGTLRVTGAEDHVTTKRWVYERVNSLTGVRAMLRLAAPEDVKGVALLIVSHPLRASDQWMWRPEIGREQRISSRTGRRGSSGRT